MPTHSKTRATSGGRLQHHHRTSSGGSSKVGLNNLHLTQKEPAQPKQQNLKRAGHSATELHQGRTSPYPRGGHHLTSNQRVLSRERIASQQHKRAHGPPSSKGKQQQQNQRGGFSIARSDETDEDDEWVSSESGAVTPQNNAEVDDDDDGHGVTPVERQRAGPSTGNINGNSQHGTADRAANGVEDVTTPRAEVDNDMLLNEISRPDASSSRAMQMQPPVVRVLPQSTPTTPEPAPPPTAKKMPVDPPIRQVRSEAPSPSQMRPKSGPRRQPLIRHSSTHGESRGDMPPHPLIRGQSFRGSTLGPARLAPLTVNAEAAQAQLTASPSSAKTTSRAGSPSFMTQSSGTSATSLDQVPSRKNSISSLHSIATLPAPASTRYVGGRGKQDRTRTLSTISNSSSSAALSALTMLPMSRPSTPPMIVHFPAENRRDPHEGIHPLLPRPYHETHMTAMAKYNPLYDCYERVIRAKHGR
ncbi:uncharacterized protein FOMMEDRAFT_156080 [Fomitiporia mediterranea MF3/22]|uniref:uncharacterized protein n=1 Tax=Fomitiporia mediterranea (strain MF3/22) TaxID=694068 RepID=UPI0004408D42|nr:uncharacterized protein FOMMEDRAFT_156080 [Fomitiporia mediterranea MF3/22]EJD02749.1 hypothetical protein FOMMEDRAFT_156080 [Fomitiporia mediterranea MF3/22]